jgi:hypothetical protein
MVYCRQLLGNAEKHWLVCTYLHNLRIIYFDFKPENRLLKSGSRSEIEFPPQLGSSVSLLPRSNLEISPPRCSLCLSLSPFEFHFDHRFNRASLQPTCSVYRSSFRTRKLLQSLRSVLLIVRASPLCFRLSDLGGFLLSSMFAVHFLCSDCDLGGWHGTWFNFPSY